jgi:hypothetical protein
MYGAQIVRGTLRETNVLIIGMPGASSQVKASLASEVSAAGGKVTGRLQLTSDYIDPKQADAMTRFATGGVQPVGLTYPNTDQAGVIGGALLAYVLLGKGQPTDLTQVIAGFAQMHMVKLEGGDSVTPTTSVLVVASGSLPPDDTRGQTELALVSQLQQQGAHEVVAGDTSSATENGLVAMVRGDNSDRSAVATVDNSDTALGQVSTILALAEVGKPQPNTVVGHYGTASGAKALFPDPPK